MKTFWKEFMHRGLLACGGGPIVLAIIYGISGATGDITSLSPNEVCLGIVSITLLAFAVAGMTAIYQIEKLPLMAATLMHGAGLYITYILIYLLNGWLKQQLLPIAVFTGAFVLGYAIIWWIIYRCTKTKTNKLNQTLRARHSA